MQKNCEYCSKEFTPRDKRQVGRFCSSLCNRKVLRKNQLKKREEFLKNETSEQRLEKLRVRYEKYVIKNENDCWDWKATKSSGYGVVMFDAKPMKAHRISWEIHHGVIPDGLWVLHKCDNRKCSNPDHLFLGNNTDNMRDMASKFRSGVRCKLTLEQVHEIKNLISLEIPLVKIANRYNVSDVAIHNIKHGKTWKRAA